MAKADSIQTAPKECGVGFCCLRRKEIEKDNGMVDGIYYGVRSCSVQQQTFCSVCTGNGCSFRPGVFRRRTFPITIR